MSLLAVLILLAAYAFFVFRRLLRYLHIFQQEDYKTIRFLRWMVQTRAFDKRLSAGLLTVSYLVSLGISLPVWGAQLCVAQIFIIFAFLETDPRKDAKKKLVMTARAKRIFSVAFVLCLGFGAAALYEQNLWLWIIAVQVVPLSLSLADVLLMPLEAVIQRIILREAKSILAKMNPDVIGITGSFGKTSVKHILGHILELNAPTLFTPGSVNTLMGVSRIIREKLTPDTRFFVVEMGAYGQGSIAKLCRLTPPKIGIITALGEAHYERFKTLDSIARAKFELAEAVTSQSGGKMVVHEDVLAQEYARAFVEKHRDAFLVCGRGADADLVIKNVEQTAKGLTVTIRWQKQEYALFAPLHGAAHANNMAVAFAAALVCGISPERACASLRTVPQIKHRLEVRAQPDGMTIIDDAYNSNPRGFEAALEMLSLMGAEKKGRRFLVTPGIVELGDKNDEIHKALGIKAAQAADVVVVVRSDKIPAFAEGVRMTAPDKEIHLVPGFKEARAWLDVNAKPSDVILLENDLPDVNEIKLAL